MIQKITNLVIIRKDSIKSNEKFIKNYFNLYINHRKQLEQMKKMFQNYSNNYKNDLDGNNLNIFDRNKSDKKDHF